MRIIKYFFLLLLLISIGLAVYIFTQKGDYEVSDSQVIKASRFTVFDYVNDYKNWETFHAMNQNNPEITFDYKAKTSDKGGSFTWKDGSESGFMKTVFVKDNDSLSQKMTVDGHKAEVYWKFKDTIGGTKVTYTTRGTIGVLQKFSTFFEGGINRMMHNNIDRTLFNLNKTLDFELKTFSIKVNGVAQRNASFFIKQSFTCKVKSLSRNIKIVMPKLVYFFKKNNIPMAGKPFVIYETTTLNTDIVTVSVCIPTQQLIFMADVSDVTSGQMEAFTCIKTTLKGDYSHRATLWKTAQEYIVAKAYQPNVAGKYIEIYSKTIDDVKNPSKWETELYIPVFPKAEVAPATISVPTIPRPTIPVEEVPTTLEENP
ncbi:SRPBCC family protein [Flavobacterium sp.]